MSALATTATALQTPPVRDTERMTLVLAQPALAGPEGAQVRAGDVKIVQRGSTTVIRASDRSIIDYSRFDVSKGERVRFVQPGASATVLNRITSDAPTMIACTRSRKAPAWWPAWRLARPASRLIFRRSCR